MDRELHVFSGGYLIAEVSFVYIEANKGTVEVTVYKTQPVEGSGIRVPVPLYRYQKEFTHGDLKTTDDVVDYDLALLGEEKEPMPLDAELVYVPVNYRMMMGDLATRHGGIADIDSDFARNTKHLRFISIYRAKDDFEAETNALETNAAFIRRIAHQHWKAVADG